MITAKMLGIYILFITCNVCFATTFLGCYQYSVVRKVHIQQNQSKVECVTECHGKYYRYAYIPNDGNCMCSNYLEEQVANVTCSDCSSCNSNMNYSDVYSTGNLVPGPVRNFQITNITEDSVRILWQQPESFVEISKYQIKAIVIHTYSSYSPVSHTWLYSNDSVDAELIDLLPATQYNITLSTKSPQGDGAVVFRIIETKLGTPDTIPAQPKLVYNLGKEIVAQLYPTPNNNGPVSAYRIIVINRDAKQGFEADSLTDFHEANKNNLTFYIAAEIDPKDVGNVFVVGDGSYYGRFYNAPLDPDINYNIMFALVSRLNGSEKVAYSDAVISRSGISILDVSEDDFYEEASSTVIGLSIAIGLATAMLIGGVIVFIVLKMRVLNNRHRLSDNQELTLQGPMIEVENSGYLLEDDRAIPVDHYASLKEKVFSIHPKQLKVETTSLLGIGKFGRVCCGGWNNNNTLVPVAAYCIQDKKLSQERKRAMLQDLDVQIKVGRHENLIYFIGTSESAQCLYVVLEYLPTNLKDLLLGSRDALAGSYSNLSESQALDIAIQISKGMAHLHSYDVLHKQLCARSILIDEYTPKISGFGIAQYFSHNKVPDYTRWTAVEVLQKQEHNPKSDVWSFACLMWEICALGGTPYGNISNNEIPRKIVNGARLSQLECISDELYEIILDCWQLGCDERPNFNELTESLENLKRGTVLPYLNFRLHSRFQYEQFYPDMELAVRQVF